MNNMDDTSSSSTCSNSCDSSADLLNRGCFCTTLNRTQLHNILQADALNQDVLATHPQLFSNTSVFISPSHAKQMRRLIGAVSHVVKLPSYEQRVLAHAPKIAADDVGTEGVFMGYDFHMSEQGPQIIEINTNAGGAFINAALVSAQTECCRAAGVSLPLLKTHLDAEFMDMFLNEWALQRGSKSFKTIAIVDENPQQQFLYPEFKMAQRLFEQHGLTTVIADPSELIFINGVLQYHDVVIDLVYNRLTDFALAKNENTSLRQAYEAHAVVVTPSPHHHAIYADKRNLITFSDEKVLAQLGANAEDIAILQAGVPTTRSVTRENTDELAPQKELNDAYTTAHPQSIRKNSCRSCY
jgi:hypothetical protein